MKFLRIDNASSTSKISAAASVIKDSGVIIYPTDTVYGLGCRIDSKEAVKRIFNLKKRGVEKALSVAFSDLEMVKRYVFLSDRGESFIREHIKEPYTFVVRKTGNIPDYVTGREKTVGVRIPNHSVARLLIRETGPIISTSANISGKKAPKNVDGIEDGIKDGVDLIIDSGACKVGIPSRVVDLKTGRVLRD